MSVESQAPSAPAEQPDRSRLDPDVRRQQILAHATALFEQRPYAEVMLRDVAAAAGVGRPLVHHYFGTKRELYLEVLRRLAIVPESAITGIDADTLDGRIEAALDRWLSVAERHRTLWVRVIAFPTDPADPSVAQMMHEADSVAAARMIEAMRLEPPPDERRQLEAMLIAFGGMARAACAEWLLKGTLPRAAVHRLLARTLHTLVVDVTGADAFAHDRREAVS